MDLATARPVHVLVVGDVLRHHRIYRGHRSTPDMVDRPPSRARLSLGGAPMLADLLQGALSGAANARVETPLEASSEALNPALPTCFSEWRATATEAGESEGVWRLDRVLGFDDCDLDRCVLPPLIAGEAPTLTVLQDRGWSFRHGRCQQAWPAWLRDSDAELPEFLVFEHAGPLAQGDLWRQVLARAADRTVVLTSIEDVRHESVRVSIASSWERTATELVQELLENPALNPLLACRAVVIGLGYAGALVVARNGSELQARLVYDPGTQCGEWSPATDSVAQVPMRALSGGVAACMARIVANPSAKERGRAWIPDSLCAMVRSGLGAMRAEFLLGHGPASEAPQYPVARIAAAMQDDHDCFAIAPVPLEPPPPTCASPWTLLAASAGALDAPLYGLGMRTALQGRQALTQVPGESFGKLFTVDRQEIESLRTIRQLIRDYAGSGAQSKPLSLAVFGPPGCGKSFSVKQIARDAMGKQGAFLEFNLSQFHGPADLIGAFHQVRDEVLKGGVPLVFWDEFDSRGHKWLQYLLAPMQDGAFQEGPLTHRIGKCVFVFAGGTSFDFQNFGPAPDSPDAAEFRRLKGPDFRSRISGYLNVLGPNRRCTRAPGQEEWEPCPEDTCFPVRRAILLRNLLGLHGNDPLDIDLGLLQALLEIRSFEHGIRSMEKILSAVRRKSPGPRLERSAIPDQEELALYLDADEFMSIVRRDLHYQQVAEKIAPAIHAFYNAHVGEASQQTPYVMPFEELPADIQEDNRAAARRIPEVLSLVGLELVADPESRGSDPACLQQIQDNLEVLAEAEHDGWMLARRRNGWRAGPRDNDNKIHPLLVPYVQLPNEEQDKDRDGVLTYAAKVEPAGFRIAAKT